MGINYYGNIEEIIEVEYPGLPIKRIVLFKCTWFDPTPKTITKNYPNTSYLMLTRTKDCTSKNLLYLHFKFLKLFMLFTRMGKNQQLNGWKCVRCNRDHIFKHLFPMLYCP